MTIMSDNWIYKKVKEENIIEPLKVLRLEKVKYHMGFLVMGMMLE